MLASAQDLEDELVALLSIFAEQRLDVFKCRRLDRLVAVQFEDSADHPDHVLAAPHVVRQKIARTARGLGRRCQGDRWIISGGCWREGREGREWREGQSRFRSELPL